MTENEYLEMPWGIEDTIENLNEIKEILKVKLINENLDGKASDDVKELEFDFDRAINALEKQIPKKPHKNFEKFSGVWCSCGKYLGKGYFVDKPSYCTDCGQKLDWSDEE